MSIQVSVAEAKAKLASLISKAEEGEEIVVTRNGRPVAQLSGVHSEPMEYGDLSGLRVSDDLTLPEEIIADFEER